jgi:hypothetical protein
MGACYFHSSLTTLQTDSLSTSHTEKRGDIHRSLLPVNALDLVFNVLVQLLQLLQVLLRSLPVTTSIRFQEGGNQLAEGVRVGFQQPLLHLLIVDKGVVGFFIHPVVNLPDSTTSKLTLGAPESSKGIAEFHTSL